MNKEDKKSISQLEGWSWNTEVPLVDNSSYEEYNFYLLHRKPIKDYSIEDFYFMIGQESGLKYLVPIAIGLLSKDLYLKADDFNCDLLKRVLLISKKFWLEYPKYYRDFSKIIDKRLKLPNIDLSKDINEIIENAKNKFQSIEI